MCGDHAAFAGGQVLGRIKAEGHGVASLAAADGHRSDPRAHGMSGVFDDIQTMPLAKSHMASISHGSPPRWTGMIARVRSVIRSAMEAGSMFPSGPMSARTGV